MRSRFKALTVVWLSAILLLPLSISTAFAVDIASLINTAGMQRMLSQRITKDYLFLGSEIRAGKARRQMKGSVALILNNHKTLIDNVQQSRAQQMLTEIGPMLEKMEAITKKPYSKKNGATMLELSDSVMELSHAVVLELEKSHAHQEVMAVNISGRQRMLSQRIGMFYAAHQAGLMSDATVSAMKRAVKEFEEAHQRLTQMSVNSEQINAELRRVENLWKTIRDYFTGEAEESYPVTAFVTTDHIMNRMNKITLLYVRSHWNKDEDHAGETGGEKVADHGDEEKH